MATKPNPFDSFAAYQRERAENRRIYDLLARSLSLLGSECSRRELRGEDASHIRAFIKEATQ